MVHRVGVVGTGAMGLGVVKSLVRGGFAVSARDIDPRAGAAAAACGARAVPSPAALARECDALIVLVVDAAQIDTVLDGDDGAVHGLRAGTIVFISSTVAPACVAAVAARLAERGVVVIDAPVSGGPRRAADGSMTMMLAGDRSALESVRDVVAAVSGKAFVVSERPGDAATFKVLNNQLAAINLAAGAEAMALAMRAGIDPQAFLDVVNASSGASWIVTDRMPRALAGDYAPHAATTLLAKDLGIAVATAEAMGCTSSFARMAQQAFDAAVARGYGGEDDGALLKLYRERLAASPRWERT